MTSTPQSALTPLASGKIPEAIDPIYRQIRDLVYKVSGIYKAEEKLYLLSDGCARRMKQLGLRTTREYWDQLTAQPGRDGELRHLLNEITIGETCLFRSQPQLDALRKVILPEIVKEKTKQITKRLRIWSAACCTGEEPYSLAIHLAEHFAPAESGRWQIDGTDISTRVLETARQGIYEAEKLTGVGADVLRRHFQKGEKKWAGHFRVKEELRRCVRFHHLNLLDGTYPFAWPFDLILCRNVMIYFDRPTQETLVRQLTAKLVPGGHLLVGHSESLSGVKHTLKLIRPAIYAKLLG